MAESAKNKTDKSTAKALAGGLNRIMLNIALVAVIVFVTYTLGLKVYDVARDIYSDKPLTGGKNARSVVITVDRETDYATVAQLLYDGDVIEDKLAFRIRLRLEGAGFVPGAYVISSDMSFGEIIAELSGDSRG